MDRAKYAVPDIQEPEPVVCLLCGAWIVRQEVHTAWHVNLYDFVNRAVLRGTAIGLHMEEGFPI